MAKPVVTQERVFDLADTLTERGEEPSILSVQAAIGGGSYSTVKRYLDLWKEARRTRAPATELPDAARERLLTLGRDFWRLADERAAREIEHIRAAARDENEALATQVRQAEEAIAKLEQDKEHLEQLVADREAANHALRTELQSHRERATAAEATATQLEARLADLKVERDRILAELDTARKAATDAAMESATLKGELAALTKK